MILADATPDVNADPFAPFDGYTWELGPETDLPTGPDPDDAAWWASENRDFDAEDDLERIERDIAEHDDRLAEPDWDDLYEESHAEDMLARGLCC